MTARRACLALASHTGWAQKELLEMECEELLAWLEAIPKEGDAE